MHPEPEGDPLVCRFPRPCQRLCSEKAFVFSPAQYLSVHQKLFTGIYKHAGKIRDYNITKAEWVLDGDMVMYIGGSLDAPKCNGENESCTLDCTLDELLVLNILKQNPKMTQKQLAQEIRKSERTVKTITISLEEKKRIERIGGKRFGYWKVIAN